MFDFWITCIIVVLSSSPAFSELCLSCKNDGSLVSQRETTDADSVPVPCPDIKDNEKNICVCLYKDKNHLHSTNLSTIHLDSSEAHQRFHVSIKNNTLSYLIRKPQTNDTGLYRCTILNKSATSQTLLSVTASLQTCPHVGRSATWSLLIVGCGLIAFYNLLITFLACSFGYKLKHADTYECDYYNTKPGEFKRGK